MCEDEKEFEDSKFRDLLLSICFYTGKTIYDIKTDFKNAVDEFIEAYTILNENMKEYKKQWETLGDNFYQ